MRLGIISALEEEQQGLVEAMQGATRVMHGMRGYTAGSIAGIDAVCVLSRIGKVAAATTATMLVEKFGVSHILFTGVAGAGDAGVQVGDIVVADALLQYDMDASPLFPKFEVPLTGVSHFATDQHLSNLVASAAGTFLALDFEEAIAAGERQDFGLRSPRLHRGLIASGDQFISCAKQVNALGAALPGLLAVEMEGAAVAQVCFELGVPFAVIRTISDNANEGAAHDFMRFVQAVASKYAFHIVMRVCRDLKAAAG
ncbi:5'-methylthioadenosine/adenosylhomocysteine nucleosidase [Massilia sp. TSP1-1-2]|uniref:5'-methylthioadenosine/adenosylhomocysteine nucleosidase n=1 Tax=Massilia sp. TSP1-1-2 TaxID=2804649 RepID=UPI003CF129C1